MTLEERIGATLAVGFPGIGPTDDLIQALKRTHAGSLVVFSRNYESPEQFQRLIAGLEQGIGRRLCVMVDHEGGPVIRFRTGVTRFPSALSVGRTQLPESVERQGAVEADELKRLGVCANLAPCIDVLVEGSDPIIGERSYGSDPERVTQFALARIRGLQSHGVAACAKHFPGLGAVPRDPHTTLPTINLGWTELEEVHLPPFEAAVRSGVAMVMSSHVCYPGLGEPAGLPATFSRHLIHDVLRTRMKFDGLILSDDLEMGALRAFGSVGDAAVSAASAGHDLLLVCSDLASAADAFRSLHAAYGGGRLDRRALEASVNRIDSVKRRFIPAHR